MGTTNTIIAAIDNMTSEIKTRRATIESLTAEITQLEAAREALGALVSVDEAKAVRATRKPSIEAAQERLDVRKATRKSAVESDTKPNRREQIVSLLSEGLSPREVADELGIAPNYVYHVKRSMNGDLVVAERTDGTGTVTTAAERRAAANAKLDAMVKAEAKTVKSRKAKATPATTRQSAAAPKKTDARKAKLAKLATKRSR